MWIVRNMEKENSKMSNLLDPSWVTTGAGRFGVENPRAYFKEWHETDIWKSLLALQGYSSLDHCCWCAGCEGAVVIYPITPCTKPRMTRSDKSISTEEIWHIYLDQKSVWRVGDIIGLSGQTVHERLRKAEYKLSRSTWDKGDIKKLKNYLN